MASKKQGTSALADSANDAVPVDETVRVPQNYINGTEIKSIDVGVDYRSVLAGGRHLIKLSELGTVEILKLGQETCNLDSETWNFIFYDLPNFFSINPKVIMCNYISKAFNFDPFNFGMSLFKFI
jgi:hypothetical protein